VSDEQIGMIELWTYENAPRNLKDLRPFSPRGTWVLQAPPALSAEVEAFLELNGLVDVLRHEMKDGTVVFLGQAANKALIEPALQGRYDSSVR